MHPQRRTAFETTRGGPRCPATRLPVGRRVVGRVVPVALLEELLLPRTSHLLEELLLPRAPWTRMPPPPWTMLPRAPWTKKSPRRDHHSPPPLRELWRFCFWTFREVGRPKSPPRCGPRDQGTNIQRTRSRAPRIRNRGWRAFGGNRRRAEAAACCPGRSRCRESI